MDILIPTVIVLFGVLFYSISYISPRTDVLFYGISAILFMVAGILGMIGYNEVQLQGVDINVQEENYENSTNYNIEYDKDYKEVPYLPLLSSLFVLLSIYQLSAIATEYRRET